MIKIEGKTSRIHGIRLWDVDMLISVIQFLFPQRPSQRYCTVVYSDSGLMSLRQELMRLQYNGISKYVGETLIA